ncbi:PD-(D/E)XK motif protein [Methanofollis aquaemaris]|nr:PD-(D/E)XK motif protein [Methanofollis aquaemaris]
MEDIDSVWNILCSDAKSGHLQGTARRLLNPEGCCPVYAGVRSSDLSRIIFFNVGKENLPSRNRFSQTRAMEVYSGKIPGDNSYAVCLILRDKSFSDLFSVLAVDIVSEIQDEPGEKAAVKRFVRRINTWISFFEKFGNSGLTPEKVRGLYGELWFIRQYLLSSKDRYKKIRGWTGPDGTPHDFQFGKTAFEVKTTATKKPWKVKISNEIQLDDSGIENLFLYHLALREIEGGAPTLPDLVDEILDNLKYTPEIRGYLLDMLLKAGYMEAQKDHYIHKGFIIYEENFYRICDGFPRLTGKDLPEGTGDINYSVSLASAGSFITEKEKIDNILGKLSNDI